jgi:hypothetical protein
MFPQEGRLGGIIFLFSKMELTRAFGSFGRDIVKDCLIVGGAWMSGISISAGSFMRWL